MVVQLGGAGCGCSSCGSCGAGCNGDSSSSIRFFCSTGDGLYHYLYSNSNLDRILGGEYKAFEAYVLHYFAQLRAGGVSLHIVMDGVLEHTKLQTRLERRLKRAEDMKRLHTLLSVPSNATNNSNHLINDTSYDFIPIPDLAIECFTQCAHRSGFVVSRSEGENDDQLAVLAKAEGAAAILGLDTDYFIFDGPGYIPLDTIEFDDNGDVYVRRYQATDLAKELSIPLELLPLFAVSDGVRDMSGSVVR